MAKDTKILFMSSRLPYPPIGGDRLKNYWLLKTLSKHFRVHLVFITDNDIPKEFYEWANQVGFTYKAFKKHKLSFYINAMRYFLNDLPLQVNYYYFKDIKAYISSVYKDYDLLFAALVRTASYFVSIKDRPKILDMADSIALNYIKSRKITDSFKWKMVYSLEADRLIRYESSVIRQFEKTLFFNKEEMEYFNQPEKTVWIPHGVNEALLNYENVDTKYSKFIVFFGKMDYQPNIDAVKWFSKKVLPLINGNLKFIIVGAYPTRDVLNLSKTNKNIVVTGFMEDPYEVIKSALCVVSPMRTGGGIQNKVLESMALGTINIVSSLAAKPIGAEHGKHFLIADNPEDIAGYINDIYNNPEKYEHIKHNARNYIRENFTWTIYEKKILEVIEEVLNAHKSKSSA